MSGDGFLITVAGSDKSSRLKPLNHLSPPRERPVQQRTSGQGAPWKLPECGEWEQGVLPAAPGSPGVRRCT